MPPPRTLVIGISLPHATFDNFAVAGTLFESFERYEVERAEQPPDSVRKEAP